MEKSLIHPHSIIGIQAFKGSYSRSCFLQLDSGDEIQLEQRCGGYIDPVSLNVTGYVMKDGTISPTSKGYVCPLGQICKVCSIVATSYDCLTSFATGGGQSK